MDIATSTFPGGADEVVLARGDLFPDAIAANYLAGQLGAPILLTPGTTHFAGGSLWPATADGLEALGADTVYIVGGEGAISPAVEAELVALGYDVERVAGGDRYGTAIEIADEGDNVGTYDGDATAILASGTNFPDALVMGGISYAEEFPLLLTPGAEHPLGGSLWPATATALEGLGIEHVIIPGGSGAVSDGVESDLSDMDIEVTRLAGQDRTTTATDIADFAVDELGWSTEHVNLAYGQDFPDALTMGPHSGEEGSVLLLTQRVNELSHPTNDTNTGDWLAANACDPDGIVSLHIAGGTGVISNAVEAAAIDAANCDTEFSVTAVPSATTLAPGEEFTISYTGDTDELVSATQPEGDCLGEPEFAGDLTSPNLVIAEDAEDGPCIITWTVEFSDGSTQDITVEITVEAPDPATNQTFVVDPVDFAVNPAGDTRTYTVDTLDADEVTIVLADPENVTVDEFGVATFETDEDNGDYTADLGDSDAWITTAETGGVTFTVNDDNHTIEPVGGEVTFTITGNQGATATPVVFVADDGDLVVDEDGFPTGDFGVGGEKLFSDVNTLILDPENDVNPYGTEHAQSATLAFDDTVVPLAGEEVDFYVYTEGTLGTCLPTNPDLITALRLVTSGTAVTDATGTATFVYDGPALPAGEDPDDTVHCIRAIWAADEDSAWDGDSANVVTRKTWTADDLSPVADEVDVAPEDEVNLYNTNHTTTATVTDQYGDPFEGATVTFTVERNDALVLTATRTTDEDGEASFTYRGPQAQAGTVTDTISADVEGTAGDSTSKTWSSGVAEVDGVTYATLTEAIDAADADDTITAVGAFDEGIIIVDESVTIAGDDATVTGSFHVTADDVTISGFEVSDFETVMGEVAGIYLDGVDNVTITDNVIDGDGTAGAARGILVADGTTGEIDDNVITDVTTGISVTGEVGLDITDNVISDSVAGIGLDTVAGSTVTITGNDLIDNEEGVGLGGPGISLTGNEFLLTEDPDGEEYVRDWTPNTYNLPAILAANFFTPAGEIEGRAIVPVEDNNG